jgi:precorrin-2 dehydrogenase/sirohydrochlorin ferrochelatase
MLVDLNFRHKSVIIIGEGEELEARTRQFLDADAKVIVVGNKFSKTLKRLTRSERLELVTCNPLSSWTRLSKRYKPDAVILATNKPNAAKMAKRVRAEGKVLLYAVDMPDLNDFNMPAIAKLGKIRVAVSTGGLSPAMGRILRKRIERTIIPEDIQQVRLQASIRSKIRKRIPNPELRRICIYKIIHNRKIKESLQRNEFETAKKLADKQIGQTAQKSFKA